MTPDPKAAPAPAMGECPTHEGRMQQRRDATIASLREKIATLEAQSESERRIKECSDAFYKHAILQRDSAWREIEHLKAQIEKLNHDVSNRDNLLDAGQEAYLALEAKLEGKKATLCASCCHRYDRHPGYEDHDECLDCECSHFE